MTKYAYTGPVMMFGRCVDNQWRGQTLASTVGEAKRNLTWQYKKQHNLAPNARVQLAKNPVEET